MIWKIFLNFEKYLILIIFPPQVTFTREPQLKTIYFLKIESGCSSFILEQKENSSFWTKRVVWKEFMNMRPFCLKCLYCKASSSFFKLFCFRKFSNSVFLNTVSFVQHCSDRTIFFCERKTKTNQKNEWFKNVWTILKNRFFFEQTNFSTFFELNKQFFRTNILKKYCFLNERTISLFEVFYWINYLTKRTILLNE